MSERSEHRIPVDVGHLSAVLDRHARDEARGLYVCAHGAGGNMHDRAMQAMARVFTGVGLDVLRFNFPYTERKSSRPDPMPVLEACIRDAVAWARDELGPGRVYFGGRSMGGRACSMLAAKESLTDGLILLAYPLHPAGAPEKLRDAHLPPIAMPALCVNGTRDALCTKSIMDDVLTRVGANWTMHWVDGADHSFHVLKSSGRTDADVLLEIGAAAEKWLSALESSLA